MVVYVTCQPGKICVCLFICVIICSMRVLCCSQWAGGNCVAGTPYVVMWTDELMD